MLLLVINTGIMKPCSAVESVPPQNAEPVQKSENQIFADQGFIPEGMVLAAKNKTYKLFICPEGSEAGSFCLVDLSDGNCWYSNPQGDENFSGVKGVPRFEMMSQIVLFGYDKNTNTEKTINSYIGSGKGENINVSLVDKGVDLVYHFISDKITIPLQIRLHEEGIEISCQTSQIKEEGSFQLIKMALDPYMGSAGRNDKGYMVVPDGSGALIHFNNGKEKSEKFSMLVYGDDPSLSGELKKSNTKTVSLPVFGINRNQTGLLGVITSGDANAQIVSQVSGQRNSQNAVYGDFILRNKDMVVVGESALTQTKQVVKYDEKHLVSKICSVAYYPLEQNKYTYSDLALKYREILISQGLEKKSTQNSCRIYAELYAGVFKQKTFLGLSFNLFENLTNYSDVKRISNELRTEGVQSPVILYRQWNKNEINGKMQNKISFKSSLGSKKELLSLLENEGGNVFLSFSPFAVNKSGNGFWKFFDAAKRLSNEPVLLYTYKRSTQYKNTSVKPGYLPDLSTLSDTMQSFGAAAKKYNINNLYLPDLGRMLYTNFDKNNYTSRETYKEEVENQLADDTGVITMNAPNSYALKYASNIVGLSYGSSAFDVEDQAIPFYQIAVSGLIPYALDAVNLNSNPHKIVLQTIETGADLYFSWIAGNGSGLKDTELDYLYGADYSLWKSYAIDCQKELDSVYGKIGSRIIIDHEILEENVMRTTFENGKSVIVNYNDNAISTEYGTVNGNDYLISGEARQ